MKTYLFALVANPLVKQLDAPHKGVARISDRGRGGAGCKIFMRVMKLGELDSYMWTCTQINMQTKFIVTLLQTQQYSNCYKGFSRQKYSNYPT